MIATSAVVAPQPAEQRLPNAVLGVLIFLGSEAMLFAGLISVLLVLRANAAIWPPPDQPRLPITVTAMNTVVLLLSGYTMYRARDAIRAGRERDLIQSLSATGALGAIFLLVQGTEWVRLLGYGLRVTSGTYGATFYTLIGWHGLHVLVGMAILASVLHHAIRGRYSAQNQAAVEACRLYWSFVVGVWPLLYLLVYLA